MALSNSRGGCYPPRPPPQVTAKMDNSLLAKLIFRLKYSSQICIKSAEKKKRKRKQRRPAAKKPVATLITRVTDILGPIFTY